MNSVLPPLYGITAAGLFPSIEAFLERLDDALAKFELRLLQVRDKQLNCDARMQLATACVQRAHAHGCRVLINDDVELAHAIGADGVHISSAKLDTAKRADLVGLVGVSCHDATQLEQGLNHLQADFAVLSPVLRTLSHVDAQPLGWQGFHALASQYDRPVYALGGLQDSDLPTARASGAIGLASMRAVWNLDPRPVND